MGKPSDAQGSNIGKKTYIVVTIRKWHIEAFHQRIQYYPGDWYLITEEKELTAEKLADLQPDYIFFPHWCSKVPEDILEIAPCICFHETDLPYGRGGSPIQNLIQLGHTETVISALRMTRDLDAGPVYLKEPLSLEGSAEDIFYRSADSVAHMIETIITTQPTAEAQEGNVVNFKRRTPKQSEVDFSGDSAQVIYNHIRMLDAEGYPHAYFDIGDWRLEFSRAQLGKEYKESVEAKVILRKRNKGFDETRSI